MHRWFFAIEREECEQKVKDNKDTTNIVAEETNVEEIIYTDWPFCVTVRAMLQGNEILAITGNCDELGNWDPKRLVLMNRVTSSRSSHCTTHKFAATVRIPRNHDVEYRYVIVGLNDYILRDYIIRFWEVHPVPRVIRSCQNLLKDCDVFGRQNPHSKESRVDRGWVTNECYVHFRIFNAPFIWQKQSPRLIYVHMQPMFERELECNKTVSPRNTHISANFSMSESIVVNQRETFLAFTEVCNLRQPTRLHYQMGYGEPCGPDDMQIYHCSVSNLELTLYRLDLFTFAQKAGADEPPYHYGYGLIRPEELLNTEGSVRVHITCASTQRPLIEMDVKYLIIRPLEGLECNMKITYERYWQPAHKTMEIGHRGTGITYFHNEDIHRENTLHAFKQAQLNNAHMVELDVQLTKDAKVVVYHDFTLKFGLCTSSSIQKMVNTHDIFVFPYELMTRIKLIAMGGVKRGEHLVVPIEAFLYDDLRLANPLLLSSKESFENNTEKPFPLLSDLFDEKISGLTEKLGFNIEVKWPQIETNGRWQDDSFKPTFDRNFYVDTILELVFRLAGKRRIIFSCFDADICLMLRFKQNLYPVMLLVNDPEKPLQFMDERVNKTEQALHLAYSFEFLGMDLFAGIVLCHPLLLGEIRELHMNIITYGAPNNCEGIREKCKRYGLVGITYDRIQHPNQVGEAAQGIICCIDTMATRLFIRLLQETEILNKQFRKR